MGQTALVRDLPAEDFVGIAAESAHRSRASRLRLKRIIDLLLGTTALTLMLPLMLVAAVAIKCDSSGPIFYCSPRVGRKGIAFTCYKFRTMCRGADCTKSELRARNQREGAFFKLRDDPRITRLGRYLRRYSIDELPQLWNVLRGDMSLVGPRPHPVDDVELYESRDLRRLECIPGITGLWQVTARNNPSFRHCVSLDLDYMRRWSLLLDFQILAKTLPAVLRGSGE